MDQVQKSWLIDSKSKCLQSVSTLIDKWKISQNEIKIEYTNEEFYTKYKNNIISDKLLATQT